MPNSGPSIRPIHPPARPKVMPAGFSLIELVVVTTVLGIVAAVALPVYASKTAARRVNLAISRVVNDLDYAQQHARSQSRPVTITWDAAAGSYTFTGASDPFAATDATYTVVLAAEPYRVNIAPGSLTDTAWTFDGHGNGTGWTVALTAGDVTRTLTVRVPAGGRVVGIQSP